MKIIAAIDGGPRQADALALAARLARSVDGELVIAFVYDWPPIAERIGGVWEQTVREDAAEVVEKASATLGDQPHRTRTVGASSVSHGLHDLALQEQADLVVVGSSHHRAAGRAVFGTVSDRLLHGSPCAVALAPTGYAERGGELRRIGVAFDDRPEARAALAWTRAFAAQLGAALTVVGVVEPMPVAVFGAPPPTADLMEALRDERKRQIDEAVGGTPDALAPLGQLLEGEPSHAIADFAEDGLDLVVCGSRAYGPLGSVLLGSVARGLFHRAPCPVIALPRTAIHDRRDVPDTAGDQVTA